MSTETGRESRRSGALVSVMRWMENLSDTQYAYLLLVPVFVLLGIVALYPLLRTFELSLFALSADFSSTTFVGAGNYVELFTGEKNRYLPGGTTFLPEGVGTSALLNSALVVTIIFAVVSVLFETLIGLGQALILDQDFYGRRWIRAAIIIPWAVPIVIQGMIFFLMFNSNVGFLTPPLADLGLLAPTNTLNDTASATFIIIVADIWKTSAFMALLILAGLQSIDRGLYDVAKVAGATKWQQFKLITFPLILPTIGVAVLFRSVQAMRVYGIIDTVSSCTVVPSLSCMVVATFTTREGTSAAIAFVTAAIIGIVVMGLIVWQGEDAI
ncbi:carbohydrate ABC transporter membrane protein 1 (CUT1 family) [Haloarcula quadrata]|jgi:multiple sugar transport system permease protein|uniref:ABC transporter permease protein n=3 Tax=Haloarcula TaxID=2237 RepID=Q5V3K6_HALMA|nr:MULTISPECIES: sugar ABC transporter permease [Haloarcula]AAV45896.1 putative ABC transporter permease protein [Haloarcula marismortui ATCC 43049]EMA11924.1 sugar ABC transporter permease [Haloarcula californiae ATCC 33799]NHN62027.1 sugar ABC transporter permease [Haloarcula sp. JP-Z28]NHX38276.1 sugar ABC transporter permease [Haloarcula sp. R1-2]QCP90668.1 sugar ABC transporter permease [Haloarcula marismortui ATCC 43049]